jgi:transposase
MASQNSHSNSDPKHGGAGYPVWHRIRVLKAFASSTISAIGNRIAVICRKFNISASSLKRWRKLESESGQPVRSLKAQPGRKSTISDRNGVSILLYLVAYPSSYVLHIVAFIKWLYPRQPALSVSAVSRFFQRHEITRKKLHTIASEFDPMREFVWWNSVPPVGCLDVPVQYLVDIDESYFYVAEGAPEFGYSLCGTEALAVTKHQKGRKYTIIAAVTLEGVNCSWVFHSENTTSAVFTQFLRVFLFPCLGRYRKYIMMDNLRSHLTPEVQHVFQQSGHQMLLRPPYDPSVAPIELCFKVMKDHLRRNWFNIQQGLVTSHIKAALESITPSDARAFFANCGYKPV